MWPFLGMDPELADFTQGRQRALLLSLPGSPGQISSRGEGLPFPGWCWCCLGIPMSFGGTCQSAAGSVREREVGGLSTPTLSPGTLGQRLILIAFWLLADPREAGSKATRDLGSGSFVLPQLILSLPCCSFWTFLFLAQKQTLNLRLALRADFPARAQNNSGLESRN